jgi:hypothetical protein
MFVARSTTRIRRARLLFLAAGLVPTVALVAWAAHLRSDSHRANVERRWQEALGLPMSIGRIEHPRLGVTRAYDCVLPAVDGHPAISFSVVELESSADEDRVRIPWVACDAGTAAIAIDLAGRWLTDDIRFRRACVIEIARFSWGDATTRHGDDPGMPPTPLRAECVMHDGSRAVRIVRRGTVDDEIRIVRHPAATSGPAISYEVDATINAPVPVGVVAHASDGRSSSMTAVGPQATVSGTLRATCTESGWQGEARGRLVGLDLSTAAAVIGDRAEGTATIEISRLAWNEGRVTDGLVEAVVTTGGWVDRRLFDRIVLALAARPGAAAARIPPALPLVFDAAACLVAIGPHGVQVQPTARLPAGLATNRGEILLAAPASPVTADRVAWLFSSPGTTYGPTAGPGAWLMSVLPSPSPQPVPTGDGTRF